jgi:hypothetical protein
LLFFIWEIHDQVSSIEHFHRLLKLSEAIKLLVEANAFDEIRSFVSVLELLPLTYVGGYLRQSFGTDVITE